MGLTRKQQLFVEAYCGEARGNATEAARLAGYKGTAMTLGQVGAENLRKPQIAEAIEQRDRDNPSIPDADEIRGFWGESMRDTELPWRDRHAASESLAKSSAMFVRRVEQSGPDGGAIPLSAVVAKQEDFEGMDDEELLRCLTGK